MERKGCKSLVIHMIIIDLQPGSQQIPKIGALPINPQYLTGQILAFFGKTCPVRYCGKIYEAIFKDKNN